MSDCGGSRGERAPCGACVIVGKVYGLRSKLAEWVVDGTIVGFVETAPGRPLVYHRLCPCFIRALNQCCRPARARDRAS